MFYTRVKFDFPKVPGIRHFWAIFKPLSEVRNGSFFSFGQKSVKKCKKV